MAKQRTFLLFLPLFLMVGNLFCLDSNDWTIDPSCRTSIESKNKDCEHADYKNIFINEFESEMSNIYPCGEDKIIDVYDMMEVIL